MKENEPDGTPPTDHDSFHAPASAVLAVPANENDPLESVVPIGVVLPAAVAITGWPGVAPVIDTNHVSPTWRALLPRELVNATLPPDAAGAANEFVPPVAKASRSDG